MLSRKPRSRKFIVILALVVVLLTAFSSLTATAAVVRNKSTSGVSDYTPPDNQYIVSSNVYPPLDGFSPNVTYALSGFALVLGCTGAYMILRDPRGKRVGASVEENLWSADTGEGSLIKS